MYIIRRTYIPSYRHVNICIHRTDVRIHGHQHRHIVMWYIYSLAHLYMSTYRIMRTRISTRIHVHIHIYAHTRTPYTARLGCVEVLPKLIVISRVALVSVGSRHSRNSPARQVRGTPETCGGCIVVLLKLLVLLMIGGISA